MKTEYAKLTSIFRKLDNQVKKDALAAKAAEKKGSKKNERKAKEKEKED